MEDNLKLQKMTFLSELKFVKKRWKALNYNFLRWRKGPFSKELAKDLTRLRGVGLVDQGVPIDLTDSGEEFLESLSEVFSTNKRFMKLIDNTIKKWSKEDSESMMKWVYRKQVVVPKVGRPMYIKDINEGKLLLFKVSEKNAVDTFDLDKSWFATLEVMFDRSVVKALDDAYNDALEGNASEFQVRTN